MDVCYCNRCHVNAVREFWVYGIIFMNFYVVATVITTMSLRDFVPYGFILMNVCAIIIDAMT
jgi:hypothetical protein